MSDLTETDAENAAHAEIARLCQPGERWRMTIPANGERDSDLILSRALDEAATRREADAETIRGLREELERLRRDVNEWLASHATTHDVRATEGYWRAQADLRAILARHEGEAR